MSSNFGNVVKVQLFGQSHSDGVGVVVDGLPSGEAVDLAEVESFLKRRQGGKKMTTPRKEADTPEILSGLVDSRTCGAPLAAVFKNANTDGSSYNKFVDTPRPSHADLTARQRYKNPDLSGGGHFSARLTLPLCFAGAVALQILARRGITIGAQICSCAGVDGERFNAMNIDESIFKSLANKDFPTLNDTDALAMMEAVKTAQADHDSVGGVVECAVLGLPAGIGNPIFDSVESALSRVLFGIPAVRGVEFGLGFDACSMRGSDHNDPYTLKGGAPSPKSNNAGGVLGGITTGAPLLLRVGFKPTPSIGALQETLNLSSGLTETLEIGGRHDPCIVLRAVPVVEAAVACVLLDLISSGEYDR